MTWGIVGWAGAWALVGLAGTIFALVVAVGRPQPGAAGNEEQGHPPPTRGHDFAMLLRRVNESGALPVAAGWSFKDSWAADLTGLIAVLAAIGAAFGEPLRDVVPQVVAAKFAVVCAFGTATTALGPIMYSALQTWKSGDDGLPVAGGTARGLLEIGRASCRERV